MTPPGRLFLAVVVMVTAFNAVAANTDRQDAVRERGAGVMSFSVMNTIHVFDKTAHGGVQRVEARRGHRDQVQMIRTHLKGIAEQFANRDFSGPARVHGEDMPGLATLKAAAKGDLVVTYRDTRNGAAITYVGKTTGIRDAIHDWFDAQVQDHGHDATSHHQ